VIRAVALYLLVLAVAYAAIFGCMLHNAQIERREQLLRRLRGTR
jgi:hypothetical protein